MAGGLGDYCANTCQPHFTQAQQLAPCQKGEHCDNKPPLLLTENIEAWRLWEAICTQWRAGVMGAPAGLDYSAMFAVAGVLGIEITPALLLKIQALEANVILKRNQQSKEGGRI